MDELPKQGDAHDSYGRIAALRRALTVVVIALCIVAMSSIAFVWPQRGPAVAKQSDDIGHISYEWWNDIPGARVRQLTSHPNYPDNPSGQDYLPLFEIPEKLWR